MSRRISICKNCGNLYANFDLYPICKDGRSIEIKIQCEELN